MTDELRAGPGPYFLETARLGFRSWREDDLQLAIGLWGDPEVTRLIDSRSRLTVEQIRERLAREMATEKRHAVQYWPVFLLAGGDHVGCCGLRPRQGDGEILEVGVHIRSSHWRNGFAEEAARAVIAHAFERLGAAGLFAGHHPANEASRRLVEKLGFRYTHDQPYPPTGLMHPSYVLRRDERARRGHSR